MKKKRYVLGFLFVDDFTRVVMITKKRPLWQAGKLNGVGGKIKRHELAKDAVAREFKEEAGVYITGWKQFCLFCDDEYEVHCFKNSLQNYSQIKTMTDEKVAIYEVKKLLAGEHETNPNIAWLLSMAIIIDHDVDSCIVKYLKAPIIYKRVV